MLELVPFPLVLKLMLLFTNILLYDCVFGSSIFLIPIIITLISEDEGSEELLEEVEDELATIAEDLNVIVQVESVKRFG